MQSTVVQAATPEVSLRSSGAWAAGGWWRVFISPLWICLLVGVLVRLFLIVHTAPVLAGDEALTGLQAEHILLGAHPVYYYGQPYMGSLEAYIIALFFVIAGPAVLTLRLAMLCISLTLIVLAWFFAAALADAAALPARAKRTFMFICALVAALPPLYDTVLELRSFGGYTEVIIIMLWLLLCALRLTLRWQRGASARELALRWTGIGFLLGLGFWIDPLEVYAVAAITCWIGGYLLFALLRPSHGTRLRVLGETLLALCALPAALLGAAPAIYWGYHHQWQNVAYIFQNGAPPTGNRLHMMYEVQKFYVECLAPRVIGGALPTNPIVTQNHPHILNPGLVINGVCLLLAVGGIVLSLLWRREMLVRVRRLTLLPLIFLGCATAVYTVSSISGASLYAGCGPWDLTGRYIVPLVIVLPCFLAAIITLLWPFDRAGTSTVDPRQPQARRSFASRRMLVPLLLSGVLLVYFATQAYAYAQSDAHNTFQTSGCLAVPADHTAIITYMLQHHIDYALATGWISDPLTFQADLRVIVAEPHGRVPGESDAVLRSGRYSYLLLVDHTDPHPVILQTLDRQHVTYATKRFPAVPGRDVLLVTPLNRVVSPFDPAFAGALQQLYDGC